MAAKHEFGHNGGSLPDPMHLFKAIVSAALLLMALSCGGGKIPPTHYYALDLPPAPKPQVSASGKTLVVASVTAADPLTQDRIVYRPTRQEVGFYEYHRWASDPREAIRAALIDQLRAGGLFQTVAPFDGRTKGDFLLRSRIDRLEEVDFEDGVKVYAAISAQLLDVSTDRVVWTGRGEASEPVNSADVRQVVAAMSKATDAGLKQLAASLADYLR